MFTDDVTLRGVDGEVVWFYHSAAVCRSWTVHRSKQGYWTLSAQLKGADAFTLRQKGLLFKAPRKGGYFVWPVMTHAVVDHTLSATLGPPEQ